MKHSFWHNSNLIFLDLVTILLILKRISQHCIFPVELLLLDQKIIHLGKYRVFFRHISKILICRSISVKIYRYENSLCSIIINPRIKSTVKSILTLLYDCFPGATLICSYAHRNKRLQIIVSL